MPAPAKVPTPRKVPTRAGMCQNIKVPAPVISVIWTLLACWDMLAFTYKGADTWKGAWILGCAGIYLLACADTSRCRQGCRHIYAPTHLCADTC